MRTGLRWLIISLLWSPLAGLLITPGSSFDSIFLSSRQAALLGHTLLFTLTVSVVASALSVLVALGIWQWSPRAGRIAIWIVVSMIAIPGTVTAGAWMVVLAHLGLPTQGWIPTILVQTLVLLPIAVGIVFVSLKSLDGNLLDVSRVSKPPGELMQRVVLPLIAPGIGAAFCIVAVLTISDFTVPSLFSTNVYALDVFAQFSSGSNPSGSVWPLLVLNLPLAAVIANWTRRTISATGKASQPLRLEGSWRSLTGLGVAVFSLSGVVVLGSLNGQVGSAGGLGVITSHASGEVVNSAQIAIFAALVSVLLSLPFAGRVSGGMWAALVLGAALPASLVGIGSATLLSHLGSVGSSTVAPVVGMTLRFLPLSIIALAAFSARVSRAPLQAASIYMAPRRYLVRAWLPLSSPALIAAGCVVAALSLTELGTTLILIPPGATTLAVRLYNMLHYGASDEVAGLSILMVLSTLVLSALLLRRPGWQR